MRLSWLRPGPWLWPSNLLEILPSSTSPSIAPFRIRGWAGAPGAVPKWSCEAWSPASRGNCWVPRSPREKTSGFSPLCGPPCSRPEPNKSSTSIMSIFDCLQRAFLLQPPSFFLLDAPKKVQSWCDVTWLLWTERTASKKLSLHWFFLREIVAGGACQCQYLFYTHVWASAWGERKLFLKFTTMKKIIKKNRHFSWSPWNFECTFKM